MGLTTHTERARVPGRDERGGFGGGIWTPQSARRICMTESRRLLRAAESRIPGGVNSPVRAFRGVGGDPFFVARAEGARLYDVDGRSYIDFVGSWGPLILGHAAPVIVEAVAEAARRGHELRRADGHGSRDGRGDPCRLPLDGDGKAGQLGHRGRDERHPGGPRRHRPRPDREVRRLLSRPRRQPAGEGRIRRRHPLHPR